MTELETNGVTRRTLLVRGSQTATLIAVAGPLAACGGSDSSEDFDPNALVDVAQPGSDMNLDPVTVQGPPGQSGVNYIFDGLTQVSPEGEASPVMITDLPGAGTEKRVTLIDGLTFQDGSPVTANDVAFSYERYKDPASGSLLAAGLELIDRVSTRGANEVTFHLTEDYSYFPLTIAIPRIMPEKIFERVGEGEFRLNPVGSGRFRATDVTPQQGFELSRFDRYGGELPEPTVGGVRFARVPDGASRVAQLRSGEFLIAQDIPFQDIAGLESSGDVQIERVLSANQMNVEFEHGKPPFDDVRVRQAFVHALDRDRIIEIAFHGYAEPAYSQLPPDNPYYVKPENAYTYDPERSRELLAEAGYSDEGPEFELIVGSNVDWIRASGPLVQEQLEAVGMRPKINLQDVEGAYARVLEGDYQSFLSSYFLGRLLDPVDFFYRFTLYGPNGEAFFRWDDASKRRYDELIDAAYLAPDFESRKEGYAEAQELLAEQVPGSVPIIQLEAVVGAGPNVEDFAPDVADTSYFGNVRVSN